jgi:hypothetical protein
MGSPYGLTIFYGKYLGGGVDVDFEFQVVDDALEHVDLLFLGADFMGLHRQSALDVVGFGFCAFELSGGGQQLLFHLGLFCAKELRRLLMCIELAVRIFVCANQLLVRYHLVLMLEALGGQVCGSNVNLDLCGER